MQVDKIERWESLNQQIKSLIERYKDEGHFTCVAPTIEMIDEAKEKLGFAIPEQFQDWLNAYSHGGINGIEILGIGFDGSIVFLETTLRYREYGLPENLLIIENCDEWVNCIEAQTGEVVSWDPSGFLKPEYPSFDDFMLDELENAIENL